jgi:acetyltransferase-like isoleucine patch superfamily enzyme
MSLGQAFARWWSLLRPWRGPRMRYGIRRHDGQWLPHARISTATQVEGWSRFDLDDHVFIGHFNFIDASGGLHIGEGCQITNHVSVLSHSTHRALRLQGRAFWGHPAPEGCVHSATHLGPYCFIGPNSVLAPGTRLGKGVLVKAFSYVRGEVPDFAVVQGQPAQVVGDTREMDLPWLDSHPDLQAHYRQWAGPA